MNALELCPASFVSPLSQCRLEASKLATCCDPHLGGEGCNTKVGIKIGVWVEKVAPKLATLIWVASEDINLDEIGNAQAFALCLPYEGKSLPD